MVGALLVSGACWDEGDDDAVDAALPPIDATASDAGAVTPDAAASDAAAPDAAGPDAPVLDAGAPDAGPAPDATVPPDAAAPDAMHILLQHAVNPRSTYLRTFNDMPASAEVFDLAALGLTPGMTVTLTRVGSFMNGIGDRMTGLTGVFSSTKVVLGPTQRYRVPGAIEAGADVTTHNTNLPRPTGKPTDIPEDFAIAGGGGTQDSVTIEIPAGAAYLIVSPRDSYFRDNSVLPGEVFELIIER